MRHDAKTKAGFFFALIVSLVLGAAPADPDNDPIKDRLDRARVVYDADMEKFRSAVRAWFERQESTARSNGNKELVDQIKTEREEFESSDALPAKVPEALVEKRTMARQPFELRLRAAIKQYTAAKRDDDADAIQKDLDEFIAADVPRTVRGKLLANRWSHKGHFVYTFNKDGTFTINEGDRHGRYLISKDAREIIIHWDGEARREEVIKTDGDSWTMDGQPFFPSKK